MRKIFVMGGGGFAMEPKNPLLDQYILSLSKKQKPKICFIGTASGDSERAGAYYFKSKSPEELKIPVRYLGT